MAAASSRIFLFKLLDMLLKATTWNQQPREERKIELTQKAFIGAMYPGRCTKLHNVIEDVGCGRIFLTQPVLVPM